MAISKDLGVVTAYGYAVKKGYTGTEEEFAALMKDVADSAGTSEAWAAGTIAGTPVTPEAEQYHNNAKYYAEQASGNAENAEQSKNSAKKSADTSEAWAVGTVGGVPVEEGQPGYNDNAKYYAEQASDSADAAANSEAAAKDYSDHIADPVSGIVTEWLNDHVDPESQVVIDDSLTIAGAAADAKATGDAVADLKSALEPLENALNFRNSQTLNKAINGITFLIYDTDDNKRITNTEIQYANHEIVLNSNSPNMRYLVAFYSNDVISTETHLSNTAWQTGEYTIPKGSYYLVQMDATNDATFDTNDKYLLGFDELVYNEELSAIEERVDELESKPTLWHVIVTGQSLAVGAEGNPALTVYTPYKYIGKAYRFTGGSRPIDGMENDTGVEEIAILDKCLANFDSLCEETHILTLGEGEDQRHAYQGETIDSALGYWFSEITGEKVLVSNHGFGGKNYNGLKKGSIAYQNSIRAVRHAKEICDRYGWNYKVYAIAVVHGEADLSGGVTADTYKGYLEEWQSDYDTDIKAITGQTETVQLFSSQTAAASSYRLSESPVPNGVFLAAIENANIHLVTPQYAHPITYASVHMNNYGYRALGEYFGQAIGIKFKELPEECVYPVSSVLSGTTITINFGGSGDLVYDGINVANVSDGHWGFELIDDDNNAEILSVQASGKNVIISLDKAPSANAKISYAYKVLSDEMGYIGSQRGVRGNLRNTEGFASMFTQTLIAQWCAIFCVPVNWAAA